MDTDATLKERGGGRKIERYLSVKVQFIWHRTFQIWTFLIAHFRCWPAHHFVRCTFWSWYMDPEAGSLVIQDMLCVLTVQLGEATSTGDWWTLSHLTTMTKKHVYILVVRVFKCSNFFTSLKKPLIFSFLIIESRAQGTGESRLQGTGGASGDWGGHQGRQNKVYVWKFHHENHHFVC